MAQHSGTTYVLTCMWQGLKERLDLDEHIQTNDLATGNIRPSEEEASQTILGDDRGSTDPDTEINDSADDLRAEL